MMFGVRPPFKLPLKKEIFLLAVPIGHGEQFDPSPTARDLVRSTRCGFRIPYTEVPYPYTVAMHNLIDILLIL